MNFMLCIGTNVEEELTFCLSYLLRIYKVSVYTDTANKIRTDLIATVSGLVLQTAKHFKILVTHAVTNILW